MATKSKGVGRGGARTGAGRKPKAPSPSDLAEIEAARALLATQSIEDLMETAVRVAAYRGRWDEVSKSGARLFAARARQGQQAPGKRQQRQAAAEALTQTAGRFAPPSPPGTKPN